MKIVTNSKNYVLSALIVLGAHLAFVYLLLGTNSVYAADEIWVFEDPTGQLSYQEVMQNPDWFELSADTSRGMTDSVFWVRVDVHNDSSEVATRVVSFDSISLPEVIEYGHTSDPTEARVNGYAVPFENRSAAGIKIDFPHELDAFTHRQLFYRIASAYKIDLGFTVLNGSDFDSQIFQSTTKSLVVGAFFMLLLYNIFLAVSVRSKIYVIYSMFLASALTVAIGFFRFYEYFGLLVDPVWLEARSGIVLYATAFWFLSNLFADEQRPAIKHIGRFYYLMVFAHIFLDPGTQFYVYAHYTGPIIFGVLTYILIVAVQAGNHIARFVAFGWVIYIGFSVLFLGNLTGLLDARYEHFLAYGNLIEALVGSAVLSYRMRYIVQTEEQLKKVSLELARERLVSEVAYGYKWELDVKNQLIRPDDTFARWHGENWKAGHWYPLAELYRCIPEQWHDRVKEETASALRGATVDPEGTYVALHPMVRADAGKEIWVQHHARVLDVEGRTLLVGVSQDVTDLINTQHKLKAAMEKQRELFAIVGHELRTPVSTIKMLVEDSELPSEQRISQIDYIAQGLIQVLEDMRVVVSPERALEYNPVSVNPATVVERALSNLSILVSEQGLSLSINIQKDKDSDYLIHEQALRQIVTNLVKNAAVHSGGSMINVELKIIDTGDGANGMLTVEDNGIGIEPDRLDLMSEPFTRGNTNRDGSGLGLYIVHQLALRLAGTLQYEENKPSGSRFTLSFPLAKAAENSTVAVQVHPKVSLDGARILLAEDDNTLRMLTERMLANKGAKVTGCVNGKLALDAFKSASFDLVITDLMMPEMDGHELTREIRATGAKTPIIAVTAAVIGTETEQFLEEGADAVLSKPLRPDTLIEELSKLNFGGTRPPSSPE